MSKAILPIANEKQIANGLCWAAALAPIVTYVTGKSITQHPLCDAAGRRPSDGATLDDMSRALRRAASIFAFQTRPISAEVVFKHLSARRPILLVLDVGHTFQCHCVCLRGLVHDGEWQAIINEPNLATHHSVYVPFSRVRAAWREGLVIHGRST